MADSAARQAGTTPHQRSRRRHRPYAGHRRTYRRNPRAALGRPRGPPAVTGIPPHPSRKPGPPFTAGKADANPPPPRPAHTSEETTNTYNIKNPAVAPDVSDILQQLGS